MNKINMSIKSIASLLGFFVLGGIILNSCKSDPNSPGVEYMPDMYRSPSYETYLENPHYGGKDSMSARLPVEGTIPRDFQKFPLDESEDAYKFADSLNGPIEYSEEMMAYGQERYTKMCSHCHGEQGEADGLVVTNGGFPPPPSYTSGRSGHGGMMNELSAGEIVYTITYGYKNMGSHASQISLDDRWAIAMYVQKLAGKEFGEVEAKDEAAETQAEVESTVQTETPVEDNESQAAIQTEGNLENEH